MICYRRLMYALAVCLITCLLNENLDVRLHYADGNSMIR